MFIFKSPFRLEPLISLTNYTHANFRHCPALPGATPPQHHRTLRALTPDVMAMNGRHILFPGPRRRSCGEIPFYE